MADTKITSLLTPQVTTNPATDVLPIVNIADTLMASSGSTRKITVNSLLGAGGTATLASATISGDLTVDTSTLKVDSTNNRVGIGTATPGAYALDVKSTTASAQLRIFGSNQNSITFANAAGGASNGFLMGRSFSSDDANNLFVYDLTSSALRLFIGGTGNVGIGTAAPTEAVDLNSGNLKLTNGNVVIGTSGKGIDFSAVTGGTGTATGNVLNDYEEGTFTPTVIGTTTAGTGVYTTQLGHYTKVGRIVTCDISLVWTAHTGTGNIDIGGLPFSVLTTSGYAASAVIGYIDNIALTAGNIPIAILWWFNTTKIRLNQTPTGGGGAAGVPMDTAGQINLSITYIVA